MEKEYDVAVIGASIAGCTAATLFASNSGYARSVSQDNQKDPQEERPTRGPVISF